jgi:general secretion pathway protein I
VSRLRRAEAPARRTHRGFTLIEVVVAMAVIAVAFTAMLGLHVRSLRLAAREQAYTQAVLLARTLITEAELEGYPPLGESRGDFETRYPGEYPGFLWERTVLEPPLPIPDVREVNVRVTPVNDPGAVAQLTIYLRAGGT